jgi:hypothetical protein
MSKPLITYKRAFYAPQSATSSQEANPPAMTAENYLGTVLTIAGAREYEEAIFETPIGGKWVDYDSVNQRDRETITITLNEVSPFYAELMEATAGPYITAGSAISFIPGKQVTNRGWLYYVSSDDASSKVHEVYRWVKLDLPAWEFPQTGYINPVFVARVLYSSKAYGNFLTPFVA